MSNALAMLLLSIGTVASKDARWPYCPDIRATAVARRISELPSEIHEDLKRITRGDVGDSDGPLLNTDAPGAEEARYPTTRFFQAMLVRDTWFVQFEVALFAGVRTVGYTRAQEDGRFHRRPWLYFGGPACESIKASLAGVTTPPSLKY